MAQMSRMILGMMANGGSDVGEQSIIRPETRLMSAVPAKAARERPRAARWCEMGRRWQRRRRRGAAREERRGAAE